MCGVGAWFQSKYIVYFLEPKVNDTKSRSQVHFKPLSDSKDARYILI